MLLLASLLSLFEPNLRLVECVLQIFNGTRFVNQNLRSVRGILETYWVFFAELTQLCTPQEKL